MSKKSRRAREEAVAVEAPQRALDRYRRLLVAAVVVVAIGVIGYLVLSSATASAYTCESMLQGPPGQTTFTLEDFGDELPGFPVADDGRDHGEGSTDYASCPPTSGEHRAAGALDRDYYGPASIQEPNDWVHNLEHGYSVIACSGDPGVEVLKEIRDVMDAVRPTEVAINCQLPNKVLALRFDEMTEFDAELATATAERFQDLPQSPERAC